MAPNNYRPRRSALYVPTNNTRALAKAPSLDADVLIYDLEDAVLADQKEQARNNLTEHLSTTSHRAEAIVRINSISTSTFYDDLQWLGHSSNIDSILLPKIRNANELEQVKLLFAENNIDKPIWLLIETVDAILNLGELVKLLDKNSALVLGGEDLAKEMRINHTPGRLGLLPILTQLILHGRSAKLSILDTVFPNLDNDLGFNQSCEQARNLGFDGKTVIHPKQLESINQIFSPTAKEIEQAEKIIAGWDDREYGQGVVLVDGNMIEQLHVRQALELLERAKYNP